MSRVNHGALINNERSAEKIVEIIDDKVIFKFDYSFINSKGFMYKQSGLQNTSFIVPTRNPIQNVKLILFKQDDVARVSQENIAGYSYEMFRDNLGST